MINEPSYFRYVVAQYAHSRRDERLNVGVIVQDPIRSMVRSQFDVRTASHRIKRAFPDVDARGLSLFLKDFGAAVTTDPSLNTALDSTDALKSFGGGWRNAIQFTPVRSMPASNIRAALEELMRVYVAEIPAQLHNVPQVRGVPFAHQRTREALRHVLHLEEGVNYNEFRAVRELTHAGKTHRMPIVFPFFVYEQFVIDTMSFRTDSFPVKFNIASGFIKKVDEMRKTLGNDDITPCLTYVTDEDNQEQTEALVAQIQEEARIPDEAVVEAVNADRLAKFIGSARRVA
jgi:hypothetical protein